jgi:hypothetical protein
VGAGQVVVVHRRDEWTSAALWLIARGDPLPFLTKPS